jgi:YgiT-type zinc finger domain-containing protein
MERRFPAPTPMKCSACRSPNLKPGTATVMSEREGRVAIVRDVPALLCEQCGEEYFDINVSQTVYDISERIFARGKDVEITKFAA